MPVQPQFLPESPPLPSAETHACVGDAPAPLWLQRLSLLMMVLFCVYLGVLMAILPWWVAVWDHNPFLQAHPRTWALLRLGVVRGVISGLGLLDIWIGLSEAIHYREERA